MTMTTTRVLLLLLLPLRLLLLRLLLLRLLLRPQSLLHIMSTCIHYTPHAHTTQDTYTCMGARTYYRSFPTHPLWYNMVCMAIYCWKELRLSLLSLLAGGFMADLLYQIDYTQVMQGSNLSKAQKALRTCIVGRLQIAQGLGEIAQG